MEAGLLGQRLVAGPGFPPGNDLCPAPPGSPCRGGWGQRRQQVPRGVPAHLALRPLPPAARPGGRRQAVIEPEGVQQPVGVDEQQVAGVAFGVGAERAVQQPHRRAREPPPRARRLPSGTYPLPGTRPGSGSVPWPRRASRPRAGGPRSRLPARAEPARRPARPAGSSGLTDWGVMRASSAGGRAARCLDSGPGRLARASSLAHAAGPLVDGRADPTPGALALSWRRNSGRGRR